MRAAAKFGDAGERGEGEVQSRITLAEPVADQFIAVTRLGAWLRTQSAGVPVMLCAEVGVPQGLDHLVQAVEDFPVPAAYQWACRYGSGFFQGQPSGNDPLGDLDMSLGATNVPAEGCFVGGRRQVRTPERGLTAGGSQPRATAGSSTIDKSQSAGALVPVGAGF